MITSQPNNLKTTLLRLGQVAAFFLALLVVLFFLRHSLVTSASAFKADFERQSFIELSRGDTFLVARKLAALAKGEQMNCIVASKQGTIFFEERKGRCEAGFFRVVELVKEPNQGVEILFSLRLQDELFNGFIFFLLALGILAFISLVSQWHAFRLLHQRDFELAAMARQVAHDIRSPLAVLSVDGVDSAIRARSLARLHDLVGHLLGNKNRSESYLRQIVEEAAEEKRIEFPGLHLEVGLPEGVTGLTLPGEPFAWRRILSNLLNNSIEAGRAAGQVYVRIYAEIGVDSWALFIADKGIGIPANILPNIGKRGYSFGKGFGSGLGLSSAIDFVTVQGGQLSIDSQIDFGTVIKILFPLRPPVAVLIDDDALLAAAWEKVASRKGIPFAYFSTPAEFLERESQFPRHTSIYLDVEFVGEVIDLSSFGAALAAKGFRNIYLATGHSADRFKEWGWVRGIQGKEPPWI